MTDRRLRDLRRLLVTVAAPFGATVLVEPTRGNHWRGVFTVGARQAFIITSSDWRVPKKIQSDARRKLPELTKAAPRRIGLADLAAARKAAP